MFCPSCGQQQQTEETRFCSRCGFLLTGTAQLLANGGNLPQLPAFYDPTKISPRRRGLKQGGFLLLLSLFIIPLVAVFIQATRGPVEFVAIVALVTFWGAILRMLYALFFESKLPTLPSDTSILPEVAQKIMPDGKKINALPPPQSIPTNFYTPPANTNWRDTNDLAQPSVTEHTTRFLDRNE